MTMRCNISGLFAAAVTGMILVLSGWSASGRADADNALGLPALPPPTSPAMVDLGRQLFFDQRLSTGGTMACATCHDPAQGFTQNDRATPQGRGGVSLRRNAPTLLNVAFAYPLMHDGAAPSLEAQVLTPLLDPAEMANASFDDLEARLAAVPEYARRFADIFGGAPTMARIGDALAAYERTLVAAGSPFDRWRYAGEAAALSPIARQGFDLFTGKAGCTNCHVVGERDALLTDNAMHNTGVGAAPGGMVASTTSATHAPSATVNFASAGDRGRQEVTGLAADLHRYRTPTLRNIALTAPYMHDGSLATLPDVVRFYNGGGIADANLDPKIRPLGLEDGEVAALVAFLQSLTGSNTEALANTARGAEPINKD